MAISFIGSGSYVNSTTSRTNYLISSLRNTSNVAPTLQAGDLIIVAVSCAHNADMAQSALLAQDGSAVAYTPMHTDLNSLDSHDTNLQVSYKFVTSSVDTVISMPGCISISSSGVAAVIHVFRGVDTTTPMDVTTQTATGANTAVSNPPSITPTTAGSWLYFAGGCGMATGAAMTPISTGVATGTNVFKQALNNDAASASDAGVGAVFKSDWTSGAFDPGAFGGATSTNTGSWAAVSIALRPQQPHALAATLTGTGTMNATVVPPPVIVNLSGLYFPTAINGTFDTTTGWTMSTGNVFISEGTLNFIFAVNTDTATNTQVTSQIGRTYRLTYTITSVPGGSVVPMLGPVAGTSQSTPGTYTEYFYGDDNVSQFKFKANDGGFTELSIDDVHIELLPASGTLTANLRIVATQRQFFVGETLIHEDADIEWNALGTQLSESFASAGPQTLAAAATLTGAGTIPTQNVTLFNSVASTLTATGAVTAPALVYVPVASTLNGTGTVTAAATIVGGGVTHSAAADLTATGTVTASALVYAPAASTLTGTGTVDVSALLTQTITATLTGVGTVDADLIKYIPIEATLSATGTVAGDAEIPASGGTDFLVPDAIISSANVVGDVVSNLQTQDANWVEASGTNVASEIIASFPSPAGALTAGTDLQIFTVEAKKQGGTGTPSFVIQLYENGSLISSSASFDVTSTTGALYTYSFDAASLTTISGADVEIRVLTTQSGGSPGNRASIDYGYMEWEAPYGFALTRLIEATLDGTGTVTADAEIVSPSVTHDGAATLNGTGTVNADALVYVPVESTLAAVGSVVADALVYVPIEATLNGVGSVTAPALIRHVVTGTLTATGTTNADLIKLCPVAATLTGTGTVTAPALVRHIVTSTLNGTGLVNADLIKYIPVASTLTATGSVNAAALTYKPAAATLNGTGTVQGAVIFTQVITATLSAFGSTGGDLQTYVPVASTLSGTGSVSANLIKYIPVASTLNATGLVDADATVVNGSVTHNAAANLTATGLVNASALVYDPVSATLSAVGTVDASAYTIIPVASTMAATGSLAAPALVRHVVTSTLAATGAVNADLIKYIPVSSTLTATGTVNANALVYDPVAATLTATGSVSANAATLVKADALLTGTGSVQADVKGIMVIASTLNGVGTIPTQDALVYKPLAATLNGTGTIFGDAEIPSTGGTDFLVPDAILASANITAATLANIQTNDANWITATSTTAASTIHASFPSPQGNLVTGAGLQIFTVQARKQGGTGTPTFVIQLYENGSLVAASGANSVTSTSGALYTYSFNASVLSNITGADVEIRVVTTVAGGAGSVRASIDYGFMQWEAPYANAAIRSIEATLLGSGTVTANGGTIRPVDATLTAAGTVNASGIVSKPLAATVTATGTLVSGADVYSPAQATLAGTGVVNASVVLTEVISANVTAFGFTSGDLRTIIPVSKTLTATGTLTASAQGNVPASATLTATGSLVSAATINTTVQASATLNGTGSLSSNSLVFKPGAATLAGVGTVNATTIARVVVGAVLSASGSVTAQTEVSGIQSASGTLTGTGNLSADGRTIGQIAASIVGAGSGNGTVNLIVAANVNESVPSALQSNGLVYKPASASLTGTGSTQGSNSLLMVASASVLAEGDLDTNINVITNAQTSLLSNGVLQGNILVIPSRKPIRTASWI